MPSCLVYFGTTHGQTKKIAESVAGYLAARGVKVELAASGTVDPGTFDAVVIGDSVHMGQFHQGVLKFIGDHRTTIESMPSAFFTVCLAAGSQREVDRERARGYVDTMTEQTGWKPAHAAVFAGALEYTKYGFVTRFIMKRIAASEGYATDTSRDYEYTDWASVAQFADGLADVIAGAPSSERTAELS